MSVAFPHGFKSGTSVAGATSRLFSNLTGIKNPTSMSSFSGALASSNGYIRASGAKRNASGISLSSVKPVALAAANTKMLDRVYKKVVALERKTKTNRGYADLTTGAYVNVPVNWGRVHMTGIQAGDDENDRTGNEIYVNSIEMRGDISYNNGTPDKTSRVRLVVVRLKNALGAVAPIYTSFCTSQSVDAHYSRTAAGTYQILMDKVVTLPGVDYDPKSTHVIKARIPVRAKTTYNGPLVSDFDTGSIHAFYICEGYTTIPPVIKWRYRVNFQI